MTKLEALATQGQSVWYDYIRRSLITSGELASLVAQGVRGVTSNPAIFEKAIAGSSDYDPAIKALIAEDTSVEAIYESLAIVDIQMAADVLRSVYDDTDGYDGYVSLEVSPELANDTHGTVTEAIRLFTTVARPNVMIKVPATPAGIPAIAELIGYGVNVNVTLIFGVDNYAAVADAYLSGLERLAETGPTVDGGHGVDRVASVASFFVSRVDTAVDAALEAIGNSDLQGTIAIANGKVAYARFQNIFSGDRWDRLAGQGAQVQRVLWASTGTKNPAYPDTLYVDELIGPDTVNTLPPSTLKAFADHGRVHGTLTAGVKEARSRLDRLADLGIRLEDVTQKLQNEGVDAFARPFRSLMASIAQKKEDLQYLSSSTSEKLGPFDTAVRKNLAGLVEEDVIRRIGAHDYTVWKPEPTEITNRLGWLDSPRVMADAIGDIEAFVDDIRSEGFTHGLLLGMGGSSLAPEVFRNIFGVAEGYLDVTVLDSTDPGSVLEKQRRLDPSKTLFIVSTKSGGTIETISFMKYFYTAVLADVGPDRVGRHFCAVTDPDSGLEAMAEELNFRKVFRNDPNIGGRYSALSFFGLVPAALLGIDLKRILARAAAMAGHAADPGSDNTAAWLGAAMGELAVAGRDKVTLITSEPLRPFGAWAEQLIAESTGKEGRGILPVEGEAVLGPETYGQDRLFVVLKLDGDNARDDEVRALATAGYPVVQIRLRDVYDVCGEFFRWEMATVIAGRRLGINPFDQPNVESAKILAREMMAAYQEKGTLPEPSPDYDGNGIRIYAGGAVSQPETALRDFLDAADPGDDMATGRSYVSIQAYVHPTPEMDAALQELRTRIQKSTRLATTIGYGPRFLHSTGQLHKGDAGKGLFIQITTDYPEDADIPDQAGDRASHMTFGVLITAQALGDRQALLDGRRRVLRIHVEGNFQEALERLTAALE
ncbi:Transaldolase (EC [Olavius algarvensis associated proteobacterium Delta 3]|nr:Transaldolase (EC [Olavius algarvensis associated proteobacterium Delta 3]